MTCKGMDAAVIDLVQKAEAYANEHKYQFYHALQQFNERIIHIAEKYDVTYEFIEQRATEFHEEWK